MNTNTLPQIALIGSTGKAGLVLLDTLLSRGYSVNALVRQGSRDKITEHKNLNIIIGDSSDSRAVAALIEQCPVIINAAGSREPKNPISSELTGLIISLIRDKQDVRYFVITGKTVKSDRDRFDLRTSIERLILGAIFPLIMKDRAVELKVLNESKINWTLIRCPMIVDGDSLSVSSSLERCKGKEISKKAISGFIQKELSEKKYIRQSPFIYL